jgi:hypothetical protein
LRWLYQRRLCSSAIFAEDHVSVFEAEPASGNLLNLLWIWGIVLVANMAGAFVRQSFAGQSKHRCAAQQ